MHRAALLFVLSLPCLPRPSVAQGPRQPVVLDSGAVVRLRWSNHGPIKARLLGPLTASTDTVRFCRYPSSACGPGSLNPPQSQPTDNLESVELRRHGRPGHGMLLGAGIGVVLGGLAAGLVAGLDDTHTSTGRQLGAAAVVTVSFAGIGALLDLTGDRWVPQ